MKKCYIIAAGEGVNFKLSKSAEDLIIAADGGLLALEKMGITPDIILGDFDSLNFVPKGENVIKLPIKKDDTDTLAAVKIALEKGFRHIFIYGGTGGRTDHTVANIQTLSYIAEKGAKGYIISDREIFTVISDSSISFKSKAKGIISVFSLSDTAKGVSIKGLSFELLNATLKNSFPIGVSNSFKGEEAFVSVRKGTLLIITDTKLQNIIV